MGKLVELRSGDVVEFVPLTANWGLAEFQICAPVLRGRITDVFIYPLQQATTGKIYWRIKPTSSTDTLFVNAWTHKGMDAPRIWNHRWCREHKCLSMAVYVPPQAHRFEVRLGMGVWVTFDV
jgi:hypothetical protein